MMLTVIFAIVFVLLLSTVALGILFGVVMIILASRDQQRARERTSRRCRRNTLTRHRPPTYGTGYPLLRKPIPPPPPWRRS
jgi:hypothetical protein